MVRIVTRRRPPLRQTPPINRDNRQAFADRDCLGRSDAECLARLPNRR